MPTSSSMGRRGPLTGISGEGRGDCGVIDRLDIFGIFADVQFRKGMSSPVTRR